MKIYRTTQQKTVVIPVLMHRVFFYYSIKYCHQSHQPLQSIISAKCTPAQNIFIWQTPVQLISPSWCPMVLWNLVNIGLSKSTKPLPEPSLTHYPWLPMELIYQHFPQEMLNISIRKITSSKPQSIILPWPWVLVGVPPVHEPQSTVPRLPAPPICRKIGTTDITSSQQKWIMKVFPPFQYHTRSAFLASLFLFSQGTIRSSNWKDSSST